MLYVQFGLNTLKSFLCYLKDNLITGWRECDFIFFLVSLIMHIFLKAYLSLRGKIFKLYTFSCSPPTSLAIKIKKKIFVCL